MKSYKLKYYSDLTYKYYFSKKELKRAEYNQKVSTKMKNSIHEGDMLYCHTNINNPRGNIIINNLHYYSPDPTVWNQSGKLYEVLGFYHKTKEEIKGIFIKNELTEIDDRQVTHLKFVEMDDTIGPLFSEHFYTLQEYRKLKLEKLNDR